MRGHLQQSRGQLVTGWLLALLGTAVYLLTLEPSTSFWDCGEFIAVSYLLQVGHPPGAPFYQLLAHAFTWLAGGNPLAVARCCNALSAVAGGLTVMFLYWTILELTPLRLGSQPPKPMSTLRSNLPALTGALCYLFCDTAWFSATESEVYSLAMLIAAVMLWAMLRWSHSAHNPRWLLLIALLTGLGVCTHLLTLLTLPTLLLIALHKGKKKALHSPLSALRSPLSTLHSPLSALRSPLSTLRSPLSTLRSPLPALPLLVLFFLIGLSPYLIIPIRAAANTPINQMVAAGREPQSLSEDFKAYISRSQYEKAPLYPRIWRHHRHDDFHAALWSGGDTTLVGNFVYYASYQLTYMYLRYLMWNFAGRYDDRQGFGTPQNGQFLTGIPPLDRLLVGTAARPPDSLPTRAHNVYYLLPLLLGLTGLMASAIGRKPHRKKAHRSFWVVLSLFLMGGIVLNLYLNHPAYEPRERDYAYILSFYAFCIFIAFGARWIADTTAKRRALALGSSLLLLAVPLLMACQNWDDHDRSHCYIAHDAGANILRSCDRNPQGSVLFTYGDNDTFPLWYLQAVEQERPDVQVENIGLMGWRRFLALMEESIEMGRPIYFTHYAYNQYHSLFEGRLSLEGNAYRLAPIGCDSVNLAAFYRHLSDGMGWQSLQGVYINEVGCRFLQQYWNDILLLAQGLTIHGYPTEARAALDKTLAEIPLSALQDVQLIHRIGQAYQQAGDTQKAAQVNRHLHRILREQLDYYHTLSPARQASMPYTLGPREELFASL